mmetsp:Transcript_67843/g.186071  ORF Transcript_67843/g.186071 Transcript_67843/m.186071 type:complete len:94 (-) Transcript_67843:320-601(-)
MRRLNRAAGGKGGRGQSRGAKEKRGWLPHLVPLAPAGPNAATAPSAHEKQVHRLSSVNMKQQRVSFRFLPPFRKRCRQLSQKFSRFLSGVSSA